MLKHSVLAIALALSISATLSAQQNFPPEWGEKFDYKPGENVRVEKDIIYARYGDRELKLDLYLSIKSDGPVPVVVVIRGGGWRASDKEGFGRYAAYMAEQGLAAASIEFRSSKEAIFPAAVHDIKAAVRWMRAHAFEYGVDGSAIGAFGGSAGGHLALMLASSYKAKDLEGNGGNPDVSSRIQACVVFAPVSDLAAVNNKMIKHERLIQRQESFLGAPLSDNPEIYKKASPVTYVDEDSAPLLLIHGVSDNGVLYTQSIQMLEAYNENGAHAECRLLSGAPHGFWVFTRWAYNELDRTVVFFKKQLIEK